MKYQCNDCGKVFDESDALVRGVKTVSGVCADVDVCPFCSSEQIDEMYQEEGEVIADDDQSGYGDWMRDLFQDR